MLPCELQLHEEKLEHVGLPQQNGFWPPMLHCLLRLVKDTAKANTDQRRV